MVVKEFRQMLLNIILHSVVKIAQIAQFAPIFYILKMGSML
jgi:hypothetical protein